MKIAVLLTCFNRKEKTIACIESLRTNAEELELEYIITDDGSSDGTPEALKKLPDSIHLIQGNGSLFWNGGMIRSMEYTLEHLKEFDFVLLINDDVKFFPGAMNRLLDRMNETDADIVVGSTVDSKERMSYGGVRMKSRHFARYELIEPSKEVVFCDTFNCNCILMKKVSFEKMGCLDSAYIHSMGDYDYGMKAKQLGQKVVNSAEHIGMCDDNSDEGTWRDASLPRKKRLELKESPKGLPKKDWFHFVNKNYGLLPACYHSMTPYIRILLGK